MIVHTTDRANVQNCLERILDDHSLTDVLCMLSEAVENQADRTLRPGRAKALDEAARAINRLILELPAVL